MFFYNHIDVDEITRAYNQLDYDDYSPIHSCKIEQLDHSSYRVLVEEPLFQHAAFIKAFQEIYCVGNGRVKARNHFEMDICLEYKKMFPPYVKTEIYRAFDDAMEVLLDEIFNSKNIQNANYHAF